MKMKTWTLSCFFPDPPDWVPDEVCSSCIACKAPFTVIRRKHHCRSCGKVQFRPSMCWSHNPLTHGMSRFVLSDLLLPLLLPLSPIASIWADETRTGVHALLHVSRHAFLQRQGQHLKHRSPRARAKTMRKCLRSSHVPAWRVTGWGKNQGKVWPVSAEVC